ncbi:molybdenum cofactor guanylyltransferase [Sphingomonas naphthae]|uniref:Molybdenum cofactor guanylyltransferase n=1 Tax=Sphingomonas naphthae TaxID=1813468 RepID=A0ABY7TNF6_9SPHN|nr:molybdenum cofactor guanylyltransferase [Sphingomonas naphthae]WCT74460.1 molybdenum cofactor guanylyltransferase [Sphingomonas naphthae]
MILGAVLAGGRSSRFGSDKAMAQLHGRPLIDHVIDSLATVTSHIVVCGRPYGGWTSLADRPAPDLGPLGGLAAALHHAATNGFDRVITAPCDTPLLSESLLIRLRDAEGDACLADLPVIGIWRSGATARLEAHLRTTRRRSMRHWSETLRAELLPHPAPANINRPADLDLLHS